jgi:outer membrane protein with glycine zipper
MRKLVFALIAVGLVAGCTNAEKGAVVGGVGGAAVGALVTGDAAGAAVGGLIGGVGGYLIGKSTERAGYCRYRDQNGHIYEDRC